jgi:cold shock CspA family protein
MDTREEGTVAFFDATRGYGFCVPGGADPTDKSQNLYISIHALKRAGLSFNKGDKIGFFGANAHRRAGRPTPSWGRGAVS